jgi:hypothetical protein
MTILDASRFAPPTILNPWGFVALDNATYAS